MDILTLAIGWILAVFIGALGLLVLVLIATNKIKLDKLLSEPDGSGSLSRFQFLIFTFVIAMSLFLVIVAQDPPAFPETISGEIFALLGISGGSYLVSKGIQTSRDTRLEEIRRKYQGSGGAPGSTD
jgi:uncharacterized BrkB/YihY/UPF0761 family membrane protein